MLDFDLDPEESSALPRAFSEGQRLLLLGGSAIVLACCLAGSVAWWNARTQPLAITATNPAGSLPYTQQPTFTIASVLESSPTNPFIASPLPLPQASATLPALTLALPTLPLAIPNITLPDIAIASPTPVLAIVTGVTSTAISSPVGNPTANVPLFLIWTATAAAQRTNTPIPPPSRTASPPTAPVVIGTTQAPPPTLPALPTVGITSAPVTETPIPPTAVPPTAVQPSQQPTAVPPTAVQPSQQPTAVPPTAVQPNQQPTAVPPTAVPVAVTFGALPQPAPSPTWGLTANFAPLPASGRSKLGLHLTGSNLAGGFAAAARPKVMKAVGDISLLQAVKQASPNTITIGRHYFDQSWVGQGDPTQAAISFVAQWLPEYQKHAAYVDYWEGLNEVGINWMPWHTQFEATRACELQKYGFKAVIGNFSTGTPEPWQFEQFLPAIRAAKACNAVLGLHEYGAPTMDLWWQHGIPGHPWYPDRGSLIGRYRHFYNDYLLPQDLAIPLIITETGVDGLVAPGLRPGPSTGGWQTFTQFWRDNGLTDNPARFYVEQLAWYDSILRQDSYVIGATIYNISGGCCPDQASYDAEEILPLLTQYIQSLGQ